MADDQESAASLLHALRERLAAEALHVALPLSAAAYDAVVAPTGAPLAGELVDGAGGVVLIGDGGPGFFARFRDAAPYASGVAHPLDDFTRGCVASAVDELLAPRGLRFRVLFPFDGADTPPPFQRLGLAAGLPQPGPLGLQLHPEFGPWWAYRALVVLPVPLDAEPPMLPWCPPCERPCVRGCATHRPAGEGASLQAAGDLCSDACGARLRCPVGREHAYPPDQLAFHLRAREALRLALAEDAAAHALPLDRAAGRS